MPLPQPTAFNTWGVPQGAGAVLRAGHMVWENLASSGANSCVIIAAWVPRTKVLALTHLDVFNNTLDSVSAKIDEIRGTDTVQLYLASNHFNINPPPAGQQAILNWAKTRPYVIGTSVRASLRIAISADSGEFTTRFQPTNMHMDSESSAWASGATNVPISWKNIGSSSSSRGGLPKWL